MVRVIKILHTLSAIGLAGGACAMWLVPGPATQTAELFRRLVVPSMLVCVLSGMASMLVHRPYWNALWAWLKAGLGLPVIAVTVRAEAMATDPEAVPAAARSLLVTLLVLSALQVVIGIWRPRVRTIS